MLPVLLVREAPSIVQGKMGRKAERARIHADQRVNSAGLPSAEPPG